MKITVTLLGGLLLAHAVCEAQKPNIVVFIADDHRCEDSEVYGNKTVRTPQMLKMSQQGLTFDRAFVASPSSCPSRCALLSGLMPARNGAEPNHSKTRPETQIMVRLLQEQGYEVVAFGKVAHSKGHSEQAGFDKIEFISKDDNSIIPERVRNYLDNRESDKPLCLMVGDRRPHVLWSKESIYDPDKMDYPEYLIDTRESREHWSRYLTDVTGMDGYMAEIDSLVQDYFGSDDFLFLYTSDHGAQWPFGKWNLYEMGIRSPLIVRWPGKIKPGTRTDAMVSWVDIMPTLIEVAGGSVPKDIDGKSFLGVLLGNKKTHRDVIYATHSGDGFYNVYPMRSVRTSRYKYIRNLLPGCYHSTHTDILRRDGDGAYWASWEKAAGNDETAKAVLDKYYVRPAEEFYDTEKDPHEQNNLAGQKRYGRRMRKMSEMLDAWMVEQGDRQKVYNEPYPVTGKRPKEVVEEKNLIKK